VWQAAAFAILCGLVGTVVWAFIDALTTPLIPSGLSLPVAVVITILIVTAAYELGVQRWTEDGEWAHPEGGSSGGMGDHSFTDEEEIAARAIFADLQTSLPPHSDWSSCLVAARLTIEAVDRHRRACGIISIPQSRLEDLREKMRDALTRRAR
jgi:hypothetical protein